jgi:hypothetical protein
MLGVSPSWVCGCWLRSVLRPIGLGGNLVKVCNINASSDHSSCVGCWLRSVLRPTAMGVKHLRSQSPNALPPGRPTGMRETARVLRALSASSAAPDCMGDSCTGFSHEVGV